MSGPQLGFFRRGLAGRRLFFLLRYLLPLKLRFHLLARRPPLLSRPSPLLPGHTKKSDGRLSSLNLKSVPNGVVRCTCPSPPIKDSNARPWEAISPGSAVQPSNITRLHSSKSRPIDVARSGVARVASIPTIFTLILLATFAHCSANLLLSYLASSHTLTDPRLSTGILSHGIGFLGPKV